MPERRESKFNMENNKNGMSWAILGAILAVLGVVAPIGWDWWQSKTDLTLTRMQVTTLVEKRGEIDGLQILYAGKLVDNLSKIVFILENTGRTPIIASDMISPPKIEFSSGKILKAEIEEVMPANVTAELIMDDTSIGITFDLLNPQDTIRFNALVDGQADVYLATARARNLKLLKSTTIEDELIVKRDISWTVYPVAGASFLFIMGSIALLLELPKKNRAVRMIRHGDIVNRNAHKPEAVRTFVLSVIPILTGDRRDKVWNKLPPSGVEISLSEAEEISKGLEKALSEENTVGGLVFCTFIAALGLWYVFTRVFA